MFRRRRDKDTDPARRAAHYQVDREAAAEAAAAEEVGEGAPDEAAAGTGRTRRRMDDRALWVDTVVDQAIRRGEFDDLPLEGKPIPGLRGTHDPDWWLKNLVEREQITGVLPAGQLRRDDAELDETLDREPEEARVRTIVEEFNARVVDARRQLMGGPPVVTPTRDVEREVQRWRDRRRARGIY
ncbi:DUF1992 domain-containing protein [Isoptericola sp. NPDC057559]|uniref:DnaJ family domain-containing protein n=1 Tax=Isoptericola sp. NPDC057559 TaxID=3346168 RepID=UPI00368ED46F